MIGMILGNRYEILKEIGSGGMANVYLAHCRLLNRNVAVKVLKSEFANDKEFLERFNKEAQAAAAISSPNIVNVYDVGHYGDIHYIVMEYVEGHTLKEYIDANGMLSWQETVEYAIQICSALDKAHKNGIVHRDIKPQNIILTNDGVLKVTDFGIARATSNETKNMGESTMGSVHYFSPEQARGGYTDAKSDIYSLGIVMYELITGILPFNGESPIAIAIKHMQEKPVSPKEFNISIPLAVETIILKAMSKEQSLRYQSAEEMLADLNRAMHTTVEVVSNAMVNDGATIKMTPVNPAYEAPPAKPAQSATPPAQPAAPVQPDASGQPPYRPVHPDRRPVNNSGSGKASNPKTKGNKGAVILAIIAAFAVLAAAVGVVAMMVFGGGCSSSKEKEIPNLVGMTYDEAFEKYDIENDGDFEIELKEEKNDTEAPGTIIRQTPVAGKKVKGNITITVTVAVPTESFVMPDYEDKNLDYFYGDFHDYEDEYELIVEVEYEKHDKIENGKIIRTEPEENAIVYKGDRVKVIVSKSAPMKNLVGMKFKDAKDEIEKMGLVLVMDNLEDADDYYTVEKQSIDEGEPVAEGDEITLELVEEGSEPIEPITPSNPDMKTKTVSVPLPTDRASVQLMVYQEGTLIHSGYHETSEMYVDVKVTAEDDVLIEYYYDGIYEGDYMVRL